ncbi:hypothetical protein BC739_003798 [Kutzneria viridogrisea]|uniref:non-specific serine/threonine protein kinase n=3 Tax=Pseudonocardiaceae TaxID=2070 RepID=W5WKQ0_9PSEU|nr:serine/threonine-protein kinase [Kutzneria albida]AHI01346.1 hypothetical protein KALB_7988 [Kutzneria albida DSM 43870]MBA8926599.1 hypothetical protein [Kutzneria viridogrisea]
MSAQEPSTPAAERVIAGRYRLQHVLGNGSMGTVWAAYDEFLHRKVAVKEMLLPPGIPAGEADALRERTLREARAIAVLSHPNVVTLHDIARQDGEPFVVMELVPSRSLAEVVRQQGPLELDQAITVADAVAAALEAAHRAGITHRDVKPGNVLVGDSGQIKLTDFGIARNVAETTMTSTGIMLGSPAFISPEVASGQQVTPAADLWSLGATLFSVLEGRPPYDADDDPLATVTEVVHGEVPRPSAAGVLEPVIAGLMVKDPAARMPLTEVRRRLRPLVADLDAVTFPHLEVPRPAPMRPTMPKPKRVDPPADTPLAADPGPLPFMTGPTERPAPPREHVPGPRGGLAIAVVGLVAFLLFALSTVGGFALTRVAGGQPLVPAPVQVDGPSPTTTASLPPMSEVTDNAEIAAGGTGGAFAITIPQDWQHFVEQRLAVMTLPASVVHHWVSRDGSQELSVQRYPRYSSGSDIKPYLDMLEKTQPGYRKPGLTTSLNGVTGFTNPQQFVYRTDDNGGPQVRSNDRQQRSYLVATLPKDRDLWVVTLATATQEEGGSLPNKLFTTVTASFRVTA